MKKGKKKLLVTLAGLICCVLLITITSTPAMAARNVSVPAPRIAPGSVKLSPYCSSVLEKVLARICAQYEGLNALLERINNNCPTPAPTKAPEPTLTPAPATPAPTAKPTATPEPIPTIAPTATPAPTAKPTATPAPTAKPTATPAPTAKPTATPAPTAKPTATPAPTAKPIATPAPSGVSELESQMVDLVNSERAKAGLSALRVNTEVTKVARVKSQDMITHNYFSHTSPSYGSPFDMMKQFGISYRSAGENIAYNSSMTSAHNALMNSPGHRANILNSSFTQIGIGIVSNGRGTIYITQMFIG
ncbi:MAG: CAP domain-containing protein [Christensenellales bacterium]|jgi:uncharacterized YkwD family protein